MKLVAIFDYLPVWLIGVRRTWTGLIAGDLF